MTTAKAAAKAGTSVFRRIAFRAIDAAHRIGRAIFARFRDRGSGNLNAYLNSIEAAPRRGAVRAV